MSLQELAGMFADDSEKPYAKYDKPEPEKKEYATGGLLDMTIGSYTVGWGAGVMSASRMMGKSFFAAAALEAMEQSAMKLRGLGATIIIHDDVEAFNDRSGMRELINKYITDPSPRLSSKSWGFKTKIINTSEKDAYKAKTRGQRYPGTGWGRTK